jgi:DNA topoisomerase-1
MANSLIIVESPSKARTLSKFLGERFDVMASMGHVRDLPKSSLGIDIEHDFTPEYVSIKGKEATLKDLRSAARHADRVLLAADPDREGEAISWHLAAALGLRNAERIEFHEVTPAAVRRALEHPRPINQNLVNAQQARRVIDRLVGYKLSPLLWKKIRKGLSAGRVQSVAVRLICDREREIEAFVAEESWSIEATLHRPDDPRTFLARLLSKVGEDKLVLPNEASAHEALRALEGASYRVASIERKETRRNPLPAYITSSLQQEASTRLRFAPKKTMMLAQQLYEGVELGAQGPAGLITYMRTDSPRLSPEAIAQGKAFVEATYGADYVRREQVSYKVKSSAQEAHEGIRPTETQRTPESLADFLSPDQLKLYRLIWRRFVASQMTAAVFDQTRVDIEAAGYVLRANGSVLKFDGFYKVWEREQDPEEGELPQLAEGESLVCDGLKPEQHFSQPPPRYTEASLVKDLEERGIGRPSTYAPTIDVIQKRRYVKQQERRLHPTELGKTVNEWLNQYFAEIVDIGFTAEMEERLDHIEEGDQPWVPVVRDFYNPFSAKLDTVEDTKRVKVPVKETGEDCPKCGVGRLVERSGRYGEFIGCSRYPECDYIKGKDGVEVTPPKPTGDDCPTCGKPLVERNGRRGLFVACSGYPKCRYVKRDAPAPGAALAAVVEGNCPTCQRPLVQRHGRWGAFIGCSGYPECKYIQPRSSQAAPRDPGEPIDEPCPRCGKPQVLRAGRYGKFKSCTDYPTCKPARARKAS